MYSVEFFLSKVLLTFKVFHHYILPISLKMCKCAKCIPFVCPFVCNIQLSLLIKLIQFVKPLGMNLTYHLEHLPYKAELI